jgi:hypothetical protein
MATIQGRNGRQYTTTGERIDPVEHTEHRSRSELAAARAATQPQVEHHYGVPDHGDGNPIRRMIQEHSRIKGIAWQRSPDGRKWLLEREAEADAFDQRRADEIAESNRQESVRPLREHAEQQVQAVFDSAEYSQQEVEEAEAALAAARAGDRDSYVSWERQHHDKLFNKLATEAAGADSVAREATARRDTILRSGLNFKPTPVPEVATPLNPVPVDRTKVAITRKIKTANGGIREVTEIVDAE